jgi:predicted nucleotidyltransferase
MHPLLYTLAYANSQKRLLTLEEIYRYQIGSTYSLSELALEIAKIPQIRTENGLYGLDIDFVELINLRQEKGRESIRRYRRVIKYAKLLISIPYIKAIFLAGSSSFSTGNAKKSSDIDIFIVTDPKRMWFARFCLTIITQILGIRRVGELEENRFCLNHYITANNLERQDHTLYAAQLYSDYIAIGADSQVLLQKFWQANPWREDYLRQAVSREYPILSQLKPYPIKYWVEKFFNHFSIDFWNSLAKTIQRQKINSNAIQSNSHNRIQVDDQELEFHPEPNSIKAEKIMQQILQNL